MHRSTRRKLLFVSSALLLAGSASAASKVWVASGDATCGGNGTPGVSCFTGIAEGVRNASKGATVTILPGFYPDGVDLSTMGQAIGKGPGKITLQGQGAKPFINPCVGRAIWNGAAPFPGDVVLRNLEVMSFNRDAINLDDVAGNVVIDDVLARDSRYDGVDVDARKSIAVRDSVSQDNGDDGFQLFAGKNVSVRNSHSLGNDTGIDRDADGFEIRASGKVDVRDSEASGNEDDGFNIESRSGATIKKVTISGSDAFNNGNDGFEVGVDLGPVASVSIVDSNAGGNGSDGFQLDAIKKIALRNLESNGNSREGFELGEVTRARKVQARDIRGSGNERDGIQIWSSGSVKLDGCEAFANDRDGVEIHVEDKGNILVDDCEAGGNGGVSAGSDGFELDAQGKVALRDSEAISNGTMDGDDGFDLRSRSQQSVVVRDVLAEGNADDGVQVVTGGKVKLQRITATGNGNRIPQVGDSGLGNGVVVRGELEDPKKVNVVDVLAENNGEDGVQVQADGAVSLKDVCAAANDFSGVLVPAATSLKIQSSELTENSRAGICLRDLAKGGSISKSNVVLNNDGLVLAGVAPSGTLKAEKTFWGNASGPTHPDNGAGTGQTVIDGDNGGSGTVDFDPFVTQFVSGADACSP